MWNSGWRLQAEQILNPVKFFILDIFFLSNAFREEWIFFFFLWLWSFKKYCEIFNK